MQSTVASSPWAGSVATAMFTATITSLSPDLSVSLCNNLELILLFLEQGNSRFKERNSTHCYFKLPKNIFICGMVLILVS